ncbi:hypothetical protein [Endozoicomonas atrinae]|uniref:hypothetical protein n=1 Tax=Endozoicomonas atrinae TaxID=1333660 RepID=UPI000824646D|nr:hypothetical protein [Endozoicomonas atrinae]
MKNKRMVYAASPPEKKRLYDHEFSDEVTSYYDQFPIPPDISLAVCQEWGLRHHLNGNFVITIDIVPFSSKNNTGWSESIKCDKEVIEKISSDQLKVFSRFEERLLIEKLSSERYGLPWKPVTSNQISENRFRNLEWMYAGNNATDNERKVIGKYFELFLKEREIFHESPKLLAFHKALSEKMQLPLDSMKRIFSLLCWRKVIVFNYEKILTPRCLIEGNMFDFNMEAFDRCVQTESCKSMKQYRL